MLDDKRESIGANRRDELDRFNGYEAVSDHFLARRDTMIIPTDGWQVSEPAMPSLLPIKSEIG